MMNIKAFKKHLAVYGADFTRWPESEQNIARDFLKTSDKARKSHAVAATFEDALNGFDVPAYSANLKDRATDAAFRSSQRVQPEAVRKPVSRPRTFRWPVFIPVGAMATAAVALLLSVSQQRTEIDSFIYEWEQMNTATAQDIQQADEILQMLAATGDQDPETLIDRFLNELQGQEAEIENYL
jgi:hypothetical protein